MMRNLFDQYSQPENRLTHALLSCLDADRPLLQRFVAWSVHRTVKGQQLEILGQSLPGDQLDISEETAEARGLPDGCIVDGNGWGLLIENKFQAEVTADQIRRHIRTASRRGLSDCVVLVLTVKPVRDGLPAGVAVKKWTEVYAWLQNQARKSFWAGICRDYLEVAEAREVANQYLNQGTLTVFSGIPFGQDDPYTYLQAKRILGLLREELCRDRRLEKQLNADPGSRGRGAITGRSESLVWDFVGIKQARGAKQFTQYPHLTLGIRADRMEVYVTIPNGIKSRLRSKLLGADYKEFEGLIGKITVSLTKIAREVHGSVPMVVVVQRHYATQRSRGELDCALRFDPRTAIPVQGRARSRIKLQPQWLHATHEALSRRKSNLQFQIGMDFPYTSCPTVATRKIISAAADVWLACSPLIDATTEHQVRRSE